MSREKLLQIYNGTKYENKGKYVYVKLVEGKEFICQADCFGEDENGVPDLLVDSKFGLSYILREDDIESVSVYTENEEGQKDE